MINVNNIFKNKFVKALVIVLIIIILIIASFHEFLKTPIPFLTKNEANKCITSYLGTNDVEVKYDFKGNYYYYELKNGDKIKYDFNRKTLSDGSLWRDYYDKVNKKYSNIRDLAKPDLVLPKNIDIYSEFSLSDFKVKKQKLYILGIKDKRELSDKGVKEKIANVIMQIIEFLGEEYNVTDLQISYANLSGYYEVNIDSYDSFIPINKNDIINNVIKINEYEWAEDYKNWRKENIDN